MIRTMWKIPASQAFISYLPIVGFTNPMPQFEHKYLGHQLTNKDSLANKVQVDENEFRTLLNTTIEGRTFYYESMTNNWFVLSDIQ